MKAFFKGALVAATLVVSPAVSAVANADTVSGMTLSEYWSSISSHWWDFVGTYTGSDMAVVNSGYVPSTTIGFSSSNVYSWTLTITSLTAQGAEFITNYVSYYQTSPTFALLGTVQGSTSAGSIVDVTRVASVPSPIAGAGLPFLLAAGALLMRRRNEG